MTPAVRGDALGRAVPDTLMDLLTERLDSLPPAGKLMAQLAPMIGREFDRDAARRRGAGNGEDVQAGLQAMLDSGLVLRSSADGAHLLFKHALVEDTAYASLPPKRCAELHGRVADALVDPLHGPGRTAAGTGCAPPDACRRGRCAPPRGGKPPAARRCRAARRAKRRAICGPVWAPRRRGRPGPERDAAELGLLSMLGPTTMVLLGPGSAEFGTVQERAYGLSQALPGQPRLFPTSLWLVPVQLGPSPADRRRRNWSTAAAGFRATRR